MRRNISPTAALAMLTATLAEGVKMVRKQPREKTERELWNDAADAKRKARLAARKAK